MLEMLEKKVGDLSLIKFLIMMVSIQLLFASIAYVVSYALNK